MDHVPFVFIPSFIHAFIYSFSLRETLVLATIRPCFYRIFSDFDHCSEPRRKTQLDAAWILTKVSASSSELTGRIVNAGAIDHFVKRIADEGFEEMRIQVKWRGELQLLAPSDIVIRIQYQNGEWIEIK